MADGPTHRIIRTGNPSPSQDDLVSFVTEREPDTNPAAPAFDGPTFFGRGGVAAALEEARATADQMVEQARQFRDQEFAQARQEGYEQGIRQAEDEAVALIMLAERIAYTVAVEREELLEQAEGEIVSLAIEIAQKLVNGVIEVDRERVIDVCRGAMRRAFNREDMIVLAHPDDLEMLRQAGPSMVNELGGVKHIDFAEERRVQRGSVIIRTAAGEINASFDGKSDKIEAALMELVAGRRALARELKPEVSIADINLAEMPESDVANAEGDNSADVDTDLDESKEA